MTYQAPQVDEKKYVDATNEMWYRDAAPYCVSEDGQFNPQCALIQAADTSIDFKTQQSHAEWVKNSSRWQGSSSSFRQDRLEIIPPTGWFYKPPSAVPMSYDRATITDYGPREFSEFEGSNKFYSHAKLRPHEYHPQENMRFMKYGI